MNRSSLSVIVIASTVLIGSAAVWMALDARADAGLIPYRDKTAVERGATVYSEVCAACHGENLEGQREDWRIPDPDGLLPAPPHDHTGHTWHHSDDLLFAITKHGSEAVIGNGYKSNMIGFGSQLADEDILAVLAYIKSTWPDRIIEAQNARNESANQ